MRHRRVAVPKSSSSRDRKQHHLHDHPNHQHCYNRDRSLHRGTASAAIRIYLKPTRLNDYEIDPERAAVALSYGSATVATLRSGELTALPREPSLRTSPKQPASAFVMIPRKALAFALCQLAQTTTTHFRSPSPRKSSQRRHHQEKPGDQRQDRHRCSLSLRLTEVYPIDSSP